MNVSLTRPETQQYNLETRLIQLDYAIQMELWQVSNYSIAIQILHFVICFQYNLMQ